jgi:hypothetical protein
MERPRSLARSLRWWALSISYNIQTFLGKNRPKSGFELDFVEFVRSKPTHPAPTGEDVLMRFRHDTLAAAFGPSNRRLVL